MKVLIIEDNSMLRGVYRLHLESRGHEVVEARILSVLPEFVESPSTYLGQFDRVICHPRFPDVPPLQRELERRKDFGVMVYKVDGPAEFDGRLRYKGFLDIKTLESFVENPL